MATQAGLCSILLEKYKEAKRNIEREHIMMDEKFAEINLLTMRIHLSEQEIRLRKEKQASDHKANVQAALAQMQMAIDLAHTLDCPALARMQADMNGDVKDKVFKFKNRLMALKMVA